MQGYNLKGKIYIFLKVTIATTLITIATVVSAAPQGNEDVRLLRYENEFHDDSYAFE